MKNNIKQQTELLASNILFNSSGGQAVDTLNSFTTGKEKKLFPSSYGVGFTINKANKINKQTGFFSAGIARIPCE